MEGNTQSVATGARKKRSTKQESASWCDESVAMLFRLRFSSDITRRFKSKNNFDKKIAYSFLASELSARMKREFTVKHIQNKFSKLQQEWSKSNPSLPTPTGNVPLEKPPAYFDIMMEYWGSKPGYRRETLMSSDPQAASSGVESDVDYDCDFDEGHDFDSEEESQQVLEHQKKKCKKMTKAKTQAETLESGFQAVKEGLLGLGASMNQNDGLHNQISSLMEIVKEQSKQIAALTSAMNARQHS
ncbi:hypothetical protein AC1031_015250 [Aphanomyces cochlioides]|nr:hypothetical protein AC1031_015250 [Aphanomyces cochlioides]